MSKKEKQKKQMRSARGPVGIEKMSESATRWIGSTSSLIAHTMFFTGAFILYFADFEIDKILLVLTTVVSLEAIYLSIFIQMTINRNTQELQEVSEDIDEIQEDVDEIQKDVDEIQKDVGDLEEEFEEISEEIEKDDEEEKMRDKELIDRIEGSLKNLMSEINELKKK